MCPFGACNDIKQILIQLYYKSVGKVFQDISVLKGDYNNIFYFLIYVTTKFF